MNSAAFSISILLHFSVFKVITTHHPLLICYSLGFVRGRKPRPLYLERGKIVAEPSGPDHDVPTIAHRRCHGRALPPADAQRSSSKNRLRAPLINFDRPPVRMAELHYVISAEGYCSVHGEIFRLLIRRRTGRLCLRHPAGAPASALNNRVVERENLVGGHLSELGCLPTKRCCAHRNSGSAARLERVRFFPLFFSRRQHHVRARAYIVIACSRRLRPLPTGVKVLMKKNNVNGHRRRGDAEGRGVIIVAKDCHST